MYNVPHQAFIVRCGYENTFMNNLIVNAKVGFALSGNPRGEKELINGNRFINVQCPVSLNSSHPTPAAGTDIHKMPHSYITPDTELPPPSQENAGRICAVAEFHIKNCGILRTAKTVMSVNRPGKIIFIAEF